MLKILLITLTTLISNTIMAKSSTFKVNYFDKINYIKQEECFNNLEDLNERIETLKYNLEIYENIEVSNNASSEKYIIMKSSSLKNSGSIELIKRGGEGGGD
jgi:hypothetical protein